MSTTRYFTHVDGFCDGTAYIEVGDFGTRLVGESGAREDSTWTLDECMENCRAGVWRELSEADVLALNIPAAPVDPRDAEIAALTERLRAVEAERDEWKRKYETQCAGSMSAYERRIHLEADLSALTERLRIVEAERDALRRATGDNRKGDAVDEITLLKRELSALRAELQRKDAALKFYADKKNYSLVAGCVPEDDEPAPAQDDCGAIARAALKPKEPPCQTT